MAAANLSLAAAYLAIARHPEICISAWTSTTQVTFSGPGEKIEALVAELKKEGVRCTMVKVPSAFHSSQMDSIGDELRSCLAGLHPTPCHVAAVATGCRFCSSVHDDDKALLLDASYWWQNVRRRVSFAPAVTRLAKHGCKVFIEVSPQPVLRSSLVELAGSNAVVLSTLRSGKDDRTCLLELAFQLKATRALPSLDWTPFIARAASKREPQLARLPPYSWSNTEFHAAQSVTASEERLGPQVPHPMVRARQDTPSPSWATDVDTAHIPWVLDHRLQGNIVLPGVTYLDTLAAAGTRLLDGKPFELADITFRNAFYLEPETVYRYVVEAAPLVGEDGCWHMSINSRPEPSGEWTLHCTATLHALREAPSSEAIASIETALAAAVPRCTVPMDMETFFGGLWDDGLQLGHSFRCIRELNVAADNTTSSGIIMPRETLAENELLAWNLLHPAVFDSCLQAALGMRTKRSPFFPVHVNRLRIFRSPIAFAHTSHRPIRVRSLGCVSKLAKGEQMSEQEQRCDLIFADAETGTPFIQIDALSLRYLQSDDDLASREWYSIRWVPTAPFTGMPLAIDSVKRSSTSAEQLIASLKTKAEQVFATVLPCAIGTDGATMGTLCRTYAEQCLANLGVCPSSLSAEGFSAEEACKVAGVIPDYTLYFCRMLRMLSEGDNSLLEALSAASTGTTASPLLASRFRFRAHRDTSKANRMAQQQQEIMQHNPDVWSLMTLLDRCGPELHNLLRGTGQHTAIDLLFHDTVINSLYSDVKQFRNFSVATQVALSEFARLHPGPLRVLEIGAGTGGTTGLLLPVLDPRCTTYHFTDVSSTLVSQARDAIGPRYPFVTFETLDIEQAPPQSMHGTYDVVVAANVLHATRNLHTTMTNVSALLRPGGLCLMMEVENSTWAHFLFGLARGWWLFQDSPLRVDGPLLSADKWRNVMLGAGFADVGAVVYKEKLHESVMNLVIGVTNDNAPPMPVPNAEPLPRVLWVQADPAGMEGARLLSAAQAHFRDQLSLLYVHYDSVSTGRASEHHIGLSRAEFDAALAKYQSEHGGNAPEIIVHATAASTAMLAELSPDVPSAAVLERTQKDSGSLLLLAQAIDSLGSAWSSTRLWVVTRASKADPSGILDPGFNPAGAAVTGFGRILEIENVHVRLSQIDLSAHPSSLELANLCNLLGSSSSKDTSPVAEYSLRDCRRYMSKLERHTGTQTAPRLQAFETVGAGVASPMTFRAAVQRVGGYSMPGHVALLETAQRQLPSGHVRVRVVASGVNFRDLMLLSGKLPRDSTLRTLFAAELGLEFSGVVEEIAPDVKNVAYRVGDSVFGFACNCISSHVVAPASFVVRVPKGLTMEEAAGLPIAFCTAYIALHKLGHVQRGERVLIHAASGGTGLAAARLAKLAGCTVVGTASSEYKRNYLLKSGAADVVLDSRSTSFESGIASLPDGGGVDVVVNSLRGELLEASLRCMRPGGRFVELGKADVYEGTRLSMRLFQDNASFAAFSIDRMMIDNPAEVADTLANVAALFEQGKLQPLPIHVRPICDTEATIRLMGQARHIGKIVLSVRGPTPIVLRCVPLSSSARRSTLRQVRKDGAYVVTGGTSGLGLAIVEHLHRSGAGAVIAVSRSGGDDEAAKKIAALGPSVKTLRIDVSRCTVQEFADAVSNAAGGLPVRGAVHAAMMLRDELVNKMSWPADIESVLGPKVAGAWSVAMAFRQSLDWMITLSSVNSSVGTQGQANYAAGNAFLDALPAFLGSHGVPCFTFNVGPVEDTGFVSRNTAVRGILRDYGYRPVKSAEVISAIFERAMRVSGRWVLNNDALQEAPLATSLGLFEADWPVLFKAVTEFRGVGRLRAIREALEAAASSSGGATQGNAAQPFSIAALAAKGIEAATKELVPRVIEIVSRVLSLPIDRVDPQRPLSQLGLDSLISVELKRELLDRLGADVPIVDLVKGPCISELVASICKTEAAKARTQPATVAPTTPTPTATATATATHEQPERQPTPTDNKDLALPNGAASTQATTAATTTKAKSEKGSMIRLCEQDTAGSADIECKALVFGFPRINGSEKVFEGWGKQLPEGCKLVIVVSPNIDTHGDMRMAVDVLADKLRQFYDESGYRKHNTPVFFFGHCLGCFLAYQTAWLLSNGPHAMPVHGLCVVACPAPSRGSMDDLPAGVSAGFFTEEALEILGKRAAERPLAVPLLAVSGSEDMVVAPHDRVAEWAKLTRAKSIVRQIRGPHNLVTTAPSLLLEMLAEFVATNTATKQMEF